MKKVMNINNLKIFTNNIEETAIEQINELLVVGMLYVELGNED